MTGEAKLARIGGLALIISAIGTVVSMSHHPSGAHMGGVGRLVHPAMIALLLLMTWGFLLFGFLRGIRKPLISLGLLAFLISLSAHVGAATINGFVVPALASRGHAAVSHDIFLFAWEANQALAKLGVAMTGLAFIAWGLDLVADERRSAKLVGGLGLVAGAVPASLLLLGVIGRLDVQAAFMTYSIHAVWTALVGIALIRGQLMTKETA